MIGERNPARFPSPPIERRTGDEKEVNNGSSWSFERLSDNAGASKYPSVEVSIGTVHVPWEDNTFSGQTDIFYKRGP